MEAHLPLKMSQLFNIVFAFEDFDGGDFIGQSPNQGFQNLTRMRSPQTIMVAKTEANMRIHLPVQDYIIWLIEYGGVPISRGPAQRHSGICLDCMLTDDSVFGYDPAHLGKRSEVPDEFFDGLVDDLWLVAQANKGFGVIGEVGDSIRDGIDDRIPPTGESQDHYAFDFFFRQLSAIDF